MSSSDFTEYTVKLGNVDNREFNIMRFKLPHKIDMDQLTNPKLERQELKVREDPTQADPKATGDGTEYRQKEREEARRRKRGYRARKINPSDQPWLLKAERGKDFIGRKEGGVSSNASYYLLSLGASNSFEAYPIANWYNFAPPVKYNHLNDEEAEERFEKRHKTMNYFSIMVSKRIKEKDEEETGESDMKTSKQFKDSDSDDEFSSVGSDNEDRDHSKGKKKSKKGKSSLIKKKKRKPLTAKHSDSEAGEETDEGDMESKEMDFYLTSSSEGEEERELKAVQEEPRDDAEVERKEEGGIDEVFDSSSSSSDEGEDLTESGKQLKALIRRQTKDERESDEEGEKEEEEEDKKKATPTPTKGTKRSAESPSVPAKKPKVATPITTPTEETGPGHITIDEVRKYLSRKPITAKALLKKFIKRKPEMNKASVTTKLAEILKSLPTKTMTDKKLYLPNYYDNNQNEEDEDN